MEQLHLTFYETPNHGYLRVPGDICRKLNISQSFSPFSYYFKEEKKDKPEYYVDTFFLEEDLDYRLFLKRCELDQIKVNIDEVYIIKSQEDDIIFSNQPIGKDNSDRNRFGKLKQNLLGLSDIIGEDFNEEITENA